MSPQLRLYLKPAVTPADQGKQLWCYIFERAVFEDINTIFDDHDGNIVVFDLDQTLVDCSNQKIGQPPANDNTWIEYAGPLSIDSVTKNYHVVMLEGLKSGTTPSDLLKACPEVGPPWLLLHTYAMALLCPPKAVSSLSTRTIDERLYWVCTFAMQLSRLMLKSWVYQTPVARLRGAILSATAAILGPLGF